MEDIKRYISRKDYLSKYDSNVGYALYVQDNIKKDDYARLNIGQIVKVIGIRENNLNKKAIYYNVFNEDWFDAMAVENFSDNLIDLLEVRRYSFYTRRIKQWFCIYLWWRNAKSCKRRYRRGASNYRSSNTWTIWC